MSSSKVSVREAVFSLLRSLGMTTIFGNPGSTEIPFFKDWPPDFRYILGLQESVVVAMADGFAQASNKAAFINLHSAAGTGHAMGSIFTAYTNQAPLVITAGQQTRALLPGEPYLFARDARELPRPYVKWSCEPARPQDVPAALARAYYISMQKPCGPTFVSIPSDDWDMETEHLELRKLNFDFAPDPEELIKVAASLNQCRNPALVLGPGVDRDGAWEQALELAEKSGAKVWASPLSSRASFPEDHPLFAGFLPPVKKQLAQKLETYDFVLVLGAPVFTYHVSSSGNIFSPETILFHITDDPDALAFAPVGTGMRSTIRLALKQLLPLVDRKVKINKDDFDFDQRPAPISPLPTNPMTGEFVLDTISRLRPKHAVIVEEAPTHRNAMHKFLPVKESGGFYTGASGGLGYAMGAAVGVALAQPSRPVICLVGDGSSMYSIQALWTAAQLNLPVTFIILNNKGYGALKSFEKILNAGKTLDYDLEGINFSGLAKSLGCDSKEVSSPDTLAEALKFAFTAKRPTLLDIQVSATVPDLY